MRFVREDRDARYSIARKRSSEVLRESSVTNRRVSDPARSSTARKVAWCTPAGPRSSVHENGIRSAAKGFHSTNHHHVRLVQMRDRSWNVYPPTSEPRATTSKHTGFKRPHVKSFQTRGTQLHSTPIPCESRPVRRRTIQNLPTTEPQATTSNSVRTSSKRPWRKSFQTRGTQLHSTPIPCESRPVQMRTELNPLTTTPLATTSKHTGSRRPPVKSVQTRGTQLDSTPYPDARIRSPSELRSHSIVRRLEETPLESASIAWSHFRSPSVIGQTPRSQQPESHLSETPGNNIHHLINE